MTPTLIRTSETVCVLTFPADDHCGENSYTIEFDPFYTTWNVSPHLPSALLGTSRSLTDVVERLIQHEGIRQDNLRRADIDLQIVTAQAYLKNGDPQ